MNNPNRDPHISNRSRVHLLSLNKYDKVYLSQAKCNLTNTFDNYDVWRKILTGDRVILLSFQDNLSLYLCIFSHKGLSIREVGQSSQKGPLILYFSLLATLKSTSVNLAKLNLRNSNSALAIRDFDHLVERADEVAQATTCSARSPCDSVPYFIGAYEAAFVETYLEARKMDELLRHHAFRGAIGVQILLKSKAGEIVAGAVVRRGTEVSNSHDLEVQALGKAHASLRSSSLHIARLLSLRRGPQSQVYFGKICKFVDHIAPALVEGKLSYISGISYDYVPAAIYNGFRLEIPECPFDSLFYWKPFFDRMPYPDARETKRQFRQFDRRRRGCTGWYLIGSKKQTQRLLTDRVWLLNSGSLNNGRWRSLKHGDHLFLAQRNGKIILHGRVAKTFRTNDAAQSRRYLGIKIHSIAKIVDSVALLDDDRPSDASIWSISTSDLPKLLDLLKPDSTRVT